VNVRKITILSILGVSLFFVFWAAMSSTHYGLRYTFKNLLVPDDSTTTRTKSRRPTYQSPDRLGDQYSNPTNRSPLELKTPDNITEEVEIDTATGNYIVKEKVGDMEYRTQTYLTFEEYYKYKNKQMLRDYWQKKGNDPNDPIANPKQNKPGQPFGFTKHIKGLEGPFGSNYVDIRPSGLVTLDFAGRWQRVNNPSLPIKQQRNGLFDFDEQISMNVIGKIGEKLKLTVNWDTKAAFEFQNSVKIQYTAFEEDIIQGIEVGRINMPLNSSLMTGPQNLFGLKTKLQFGRLAVTAVAARQDGKLDEIVVGGGGQGRTFEIKADGYEDYRHFFLGQFFRENFEQSLKSSPTILSGVQVKRVDVYITNRNNTTANLRNVVGYLDLGESDSIYRTGLKDATTNKAPYNEINKLYTGANPITNFRTINDLPADVAKLNTECGCTFEDGTDYTYLKSARKLAASEFTFNPDLGYITLQTKITPDMALLVAYQYTYNGNDYTVGELSESYANIGADSLVIAKMIKPPVVKTRLPTWDLMLKNIYQLGVTQIQRDNFQFRIIYKDDASGADIPNLQEGTNTQNVPLLRLMGLDRLNPNNDPIPDGNFDFVDGVTIDAKNGRILFPVLEPFGSNLNKYFLPTEADLKNKYVYFELYDSTMSDAMQIASKDKYYFSGRYTAGTASEIILPGINISPGSVAVIAGSNTLSEGVDYTVDYNLGRVKILNEGVLASGQEIHIRFEKQDLFNFRRKTFLGTRLDYKVNDNILLGSTILHSNEAPNITRVNIGDEPASNTIWGLDANVKQDSRWLTRAVDLLPIVATKAPSNITFQGEGAQFIPGYNKIIDKNGGGEGGIAFIDDFEGAMTPYDLTRSPLAWRISSTPSNVKLFPESANSDLTYTYKRAKLAWYNIDNIFYRSNNGLPSYISYDKINNHFERNITQTELFPNQDPNVAVTNIPTLDLAYYPSERGSYNYQTDLMPDGSLKNPKANWAGITKDIKNDIDFDNANIQYIEFWLLSPYVNANTTYGHTNIDGVPFDRTNKGTLYFNLGSISEDVLKDNLQSFENGLPVDPAQISTNTTSTTWGRVTNQQFITNAFDNSAGSRDMQDIGLDGLNDADEKTFFATYSAAIQNSATLTQAAKDQIMSDVSSDDFSYYLGSTQDANEVSILGRYKNYNRTQNNSPINAGAAVTPSNTNLPDNEDLNADNSLNTVEEYYEYQVNIDPSQFIVGQNYIVSSRDYTVTFSDHSPAETVTWYQFRIPIRTPDAVVGDIQGYKSIKWMRTYVTGFGTPVVLRMANFQLVANQWRVYQPDDISTTGGSPNYRTDNTVLDLSVVNVEQNSSTDGNSTPYALPPGFNRDYDATSVVTRRINEQSLRLCVDGIMDGTARAAYKNVVLNLMNYTKVDMFVHAECDPTKAVKSNLKDGDAVAFLRLGTDYKDNYYEIQVPLHFTVPINSTDPNEVWRSENQISINISDLIDTKVARNSAGFALSNPYTRVLPNGQILVVVGNPDMSAVVTAMLGVKNPIGGNENPLTFCIWDDELRVSGFVSHSSYAYAGKLNLGLADFAKISSSIRYTSAGFGSLDQKTSAMSRVNTMEYGIISNVNLEKFIPGKTGIKLPMYIGYNAKDITPKYDPLNPDVSLAQSVNNAEDPKGYKKLIIDQTIMKAINFTNVQKVKVKPNAKKHIYDIENLTLSVGYSQTKQSNFNIKAYELLKYNAGIGYSYSTTGKNHTPFKGMRSSRGLITPLVKEWNITLMPSQITFRTDLNRQLTSTQYYQAGPLTPVQSAIYQKSYILTRNYGLLWNLTKSVSTTYKANAYAIIDEPNGTPGSAEYRDSTKSNLKHFGRLKNFDQSVTMTYKLPLDKIKILNWMNMDYSYSGGYVWASGALIQRDTLGNSIQNNRMNTVNAKIDLDKLYSKSKFLAEMKKPKPPFKKPDPKDTLPPPRNHTVMKAAFKTLMMIKNANLTYTQTDATTMAGYMGTPKYLGFTDDINNAGTMLPFLLGSQDPSIKNKLASDSLVSKVRSLNTPFTQTHSQTITARANIEPIKDFKIVLESKLTATKLYTELFRIDSSNGNRYVSDNPFQSGSYTISTITILSAFDKHVSGSNDPNSSANFERFKAYREVMLDRLGNNGTEYGDNSQSVLLPAFLAAYTGKDPNKTNLSGMPKIPIPGWQIDYAGLAKAKMFAKKFQSITISHKYSSQYLVGSYMTSSVYNSSYITPNSSFFDTPRIPDSINSTGQIVPIYVISGVTVNEAFAPFIGFNARTKNKISYKLTYSRTRTLNMSLTNAQLTESLNNSWQVGIGFARSNVPIPKFLTGGQKINLKNELNIQVNFTLNDMITYQRNFTENSTVTAGNTNIQFKPTISYNISQRVTLQFYFERTINSPKISSSYRRATTAIGIQLRFTLS